MALTTVPASLSATALTLTTAAQPNITSVGTLIGLTMSGALTLNTGNSGVPTINLSHSNTGADNFRIMAGDEKRNLHTRYRGYI